MGSKEEDLFPWEEESEGRFKGIGILPEKANLKCKSRSKPKVGGQEYLDLYLLAKERERLGKVGQVIGRIQRQTARSWRETAKETFKIRKTVLVAEEKEAGAKGKVEKTRKRAPKKPMKTVALDY